MKNVSIVKKTYEAKALESLGKKKIEKVLFIHGFRILKTVS